MSAGHSIQAAIVPVVSIVSIGRRVGEAAEAAVISSPTAKALAERTNLDAALLRIHVLVVGSDRRSCAQHHRSQDPKYKVSPHHWVSFDREKLGCACVPEIDHSQYDNATAPDVSALSWGRLLGAHAVLGASPAKASAETDRNAFCFYFSDLRGGVEHAISRLNDIGPIASIIISAKFWRIGVSAGTSASSYLLATRQDQK